MLFVPYTHDSALKREIQEMDDKFNPHKYSGKVKVLEKLGKTIGESLSNPYPWKNSNCGCPNCKPCESKPGSCKSRNCIYQIECETCKQDGIKSLYIGETHRTWYERSSEHQKKLENRTEDSALHKHWAKCHPERTEAPIFSFNVGRTYRTSTERQVAEAIRIETTECVNLLNSKSEYRHNPIVRQTIEFRGEIWQDSKPEEQNDEQHVPKDHGDQDKVTDPFKDQFKQRKAKRKADQMTKVQTNPRTDTEPDVQNQNEICPEHDQGDAPLEQAPGHHREGPTTSSMRPRVEITVKGKVIQKLSQTCKRKKRKTT